MNVIRCDRCSLIIDSVEKIADVVIEHSTHEPLRIDLCEVCRRSFWTWMRRHDKIATEGEKVVVGPVKPFSVVQREILDMLSGPDLVCGIDELLKLNPSYTDSALAMSLGFRTSYTDSALAMSLGFRTK